ncbi:GNAT family N-acetyltransferase [Pseudomonas sp. LD120]|uniref:GNAT family N-acetyltransferase n=1 Tax=Pseudomonas sp. LD120 TaxID=485751 RepID=UPI00135A38DE|nr:GNAT family N-acetyltransferase [Pseudomonas sp. LD120]KAF0861659.1 GNAT family N-acetyltransferase [Pseudomonas sp. LD120]
MAALHCLLMRRDLSAAQTPPQWPEGVSVQHYTPELAEAVHHLMHLGYQDGGGNVPTLDSWRQAFETNAEYDPSLCWVVSDGEGLIGVAQCWTSAYIKDLVVLPRARGQGVGRALLQQIFVMFAERREGFVDLRVLEDNQRARRLYESVGMHIVRHEQVPQGA